ncbi:hypothetical protein V6Z12_D07G157500 [Gossypium hirsutum]
MSLSNSPSIALFFLPEPSFRFNQAFVLFVDQIPAIPWHTQALILPDC